MKYILSFRLIALVIFLSIFTVFESHSSDRNTEAMRNYDLGISYIKSDLYEDGLKTLNQVAFLYPDSDVADDALFQLALIREQVAENKIDIGIQESIETVRKELNKLKNDNTSLGNKINAILAGELVSASAINKAITQYILALDYLNTLIERYPESDKLTEAKLKVEEILKKIDALIPKPPPAKKPHPEGCLYMLAILGTVLVLVYISEYFTYH